MNSIAVRRVRQRSFEFFAENPSNSYFIIILIEFLTIFCEKCLNVHTNKFVRGSTRSCQRKRFIFLGNKTLSAHAVFNLNLIETLFKLNLRRIMIRSLFWSVPIFDNAKNAWAYKNTSSLHSTPSYEISAFQEHTH